MPAWSHYADLLASAGSVLERMGKSESDLLQAQLWRQFAMNISQGYFLLFQSTPDHPEFSPFENSVFLAQPNPDAVYYYRRRSAARPCAGAGSARGCAANGERRNG